MIIVLDSNEYINFLNKKSLYLNKLFDKNIVIYVNEIIIREVLRNIKETLKREFYNILFRNNIILNTKKLPNHLYYKYKNLGFRKGDIEIAAFCDSVNVDYLISVNRHFLKEIRFDRFKVVSMNDFLRMQNHI